MTTPIEITPAEPDLDAIAAAEGHVAVLVGGDGKLDRLARRVNRLTRGALERAVAGEAFGKLKAGETLELRYPGGMAAEAVHVARLERRPGPIEARKAGAALAKAAGGKPLLVLAGTLQRVDELALGLMLRAYSFDEMKSAAADPASPVTLMATGADGDALADARARAEGVLFTRDLVNLPANVLSTTGFAERLSGLAEIGLEVEVLEEERLAELGMRLLLAVGEGSATPSRVVVLRWNGGGEAAPLALCGKGVVFDSGGISIKPASGMEEMTMDMAGAGVVAGVMRTLALRRAPANVVGLVGLVENMPDGRAARPGDIVASMKGDTVEIINTDAEGRLVLADVLWHAQQALDPAAVIDLATLTGAVIIALGHEKAGVFANDDALAEAFLKAAAAEDEGAWRLPLAEAYDKKLKSEKADMKNVGGRDAGSITAAQFLQRFVTEGRPWIHLDIAGVAGISFATDYAPKGATGWGVLALDRLVRDRFETG